MDSIEDMPEYEMGKEVLRKMGMEEEKLDRYLYDLFAMIDTVHEAVEREHQEKMLAERTTLLALERAKDNAKLERLLEATRKKRKQSS